MATTTKDFITRYGVLIQGNNNVSSSTNQTNALQVNGGAAIAKNLIVGTDADIHGNVISRKTLIANGEIFLNGVTTVSNILNVTGNSSFSNPPTFNDGFVSNGNSIFNGPLTLNGGGTLSLGTGSLSLSGDLTVGGLVTFNSSTEAASGGIGALVVPNGGIYAGNNLYIAGTSANEGVKTANALYVAGGTWIDKSLVVEGSVLFKNGVTFSGTATYVYSTNTIFSDNILNLHTPPGGISEPWTLDDGKDIGIVFHHYKTFDSDSFLGWSNDNGYLEWYGDGQETLGGTFTNGVYGIFKTGGIILVNSETSVSSSTGALQVLGGISAGNLYTYDGVNAETLSARNLVQGRIVFVGANGQLVDDEEITYNSSNNILNGTITTAITATNLAGGGPGMVPYQSDTGITNFINTGTTGNVLISKGTNAPEWEPLSGISAGNAVTATNVAGGLANQIVIQTAPGTTGFVGPGNSGQFLRSNGSGTPPSFVNTGNMYVGFAIYANNLTGPINGIPYQSAVDTTNFITPGANGTLLQSNGTTATFVNTSTLLVGFAENAYTADRWTTPRTVTLAGDISGNVTFDGSTDFIFTATVNSGGFSNTATNLAGGTTGAIPYQLASSSSTFLTLSGTEHSVISAGTTAPKYVTQVQAKSGTGSLTTTSNQSLYVSNGGLGIVGNSYFADNVAIGSDLKIKGTSNSTSTQTGSLQVMGGVAIAKDIVIGGAVKIGSTIDSTVIPAIYSNNFILASFTSQTILNTSPVNLDQYNQNEYRTARYTVQIVDGSNIHITEIMVTHNGTNVYINEYGIITNNGELGVFSANSNETNITLTFTPTTVTSMIIKVARFGITA